MKERMNRKGMNDRKIGLFLQFGKFTIFSPSVFLFFLSLITVSPNLKISGLKKTYNKYSCPVSHCCILKAGSRFESLVQCFMVVDSLEPLSSAVPVA